MMKRTSVAVSIGLMLGMIRWIAGDAFAQSANVPATQSLTTTRPADELPKDSPIRVWFSRLADADPAIRDQARQDLMGISADDLPKLRQLVIESLPLTPDQTAGLRDVVRQAYLASEKYAMPAGGETDPTGTEGPFFLGMLWGPETSMDPRLGVTVDERLPGFPSYRFLRKGDMILGIYIDPKVPLLELPNVETHDRESLIGAIQRSPRTQDIELQVLRNGCQIRVPVKMAPRPLDANPIATGSLAAFTAARAERAESYWQENFAPLLDQVCRGD